MPHQKNICNCGKTIHWSKNANGGQMECRKCNSLWTMVDSGGQQGQIVGSKPPRTKSSNNSTESPGCVVLILMIPIILIFIWKFCFEIIT